MSEQVKRVILIDAQSAMYQRYVTLIQVCIELDETAKIPGYLNDMDHIHNAITAIAKP